MSLTKEIFVAATLKGLQRRHAKSVSKKKPFTIEMLQAVAVEAKVFVRPVSCLLAYSAFLRFDKLRRIIPADIMFHEGWISIKIHKGKVDQLRKGEEVIVAKTGSELCPVAMLESYMLQARLQKMDKSFLFHRITKLKSGERFREGASLSYTRLRECLKEKLVQLGFPASQFKLHSLRVGWGNSGSKFEST